MKQVQEALANIGIPVMAEVIPAHRVGEFRKGS